MGKIAAIHNYSTSDVSINTRSKELDDECKLKEHRTLKRSLEITRKQGQNQITRTNSMIWHFWLEARPTQPLLSFTKELTQSNKETLELET